MEANDRMKYALVVLAFAAWGALVVMGKAAPDRYVDALAISITGLGVHGATKRRAKSTASEADSTAALASNASAVGAGQRTAASPVAQPTPQAAAPATVQ